MIEMRKTGLSILGLCAAILTLASGCSSGPDKEYAIGLSNDLAEKAVKEARLRLLIHDHMKNGRAEKARDLIETRIEGDILILNELSRKLPSVWERYPKTFAEVIKAKSECEKALAAKGERDRK